ncbi:hypothetical protein EUTSA_v10023229mg [Eutrema salsugineum]|uniref:Uncharacterized protein n=1 Tax=Eutrema salsugineum TaxID=72664 RepID=V4MCW5_EUTSA|nr:hypothetical protein EUTSA_v10023229mg [Eutrema salsugineum]
MAEAYPPEIRCVFVETDLDTNLAVLVNIHETISDFKKKLCKQHEQCHPKVGEINISAVKVKRRNRFYRLPDCMILSKAFEGINRSWYMYVDATLTVDKGELLTIMDADQNCSNHELVEKKKEIAEDSVLLDGYPKSLTLEEDFETEVVEKTSKKRKLKSLDGEKSRKKPSVDLNQSVAAASTALRCDVDGSHELGGEVQVDVVASESCAVLPRETLDDVLTGANRKENERDKIEADNLANHAENHLDASSGLTTRPDTEKEKDAGQNCSNHELFEKEKEIVNDSLRLDGCTMNLTLEKGVETEVSEKTTKKRKLKSMGGNKSQKKPSTDLNQLAAATAASRLDVDESHDLGGKVQVGVVASESSPGEKLVDTLMGAIGKENEMGEKSTEGVGRDTVETVNIASDRANPLDVSNLQKEKKKRRKKSSKDDINQSSSVATTTSRDTVNEINGVPGTVDRVDATSESLPISSRGNLGNPSAEARQEENKMVEKSVEDVRRDNNEADNLASHPENYLDANSGLTTRTDTEKKKRRKKSSKDDINQSSVATTISGDIVNEINKVPGNVDRVDATSESLPISRNGNLGNPFPEARQKANEMVEKTVEDVRRDNIGTDNLATANHVDANSGLTTRTDTEKKKRRKKSSKDDINIAAPTTSGNIVNERNGVPENVDHVDATFESLPISRSGKLGDPFAEANQKEIEMGEKIDENVGSGNAIPSAAETIQTNNVDIDAGETKSVKSTKKKKSKKAKTLSKEDTTVASGENVEPVEVVDEEPDNVIRNVLDSLQETNDTEENLGKIEKKSSKKSKKKHSLKERYRERCFALKQSTVAADNTESSSSPACSKEKADIGDNFDSSQKDDTVGGGKKQEDQVTNGAKSKKEKKRLNLHPDGSIDGSLSSMKPKEKKGRVQPASSGTSQLHSRVKNDRSGSVKVDVNSKKEAVKKSSESLTVKTNFFKDAELCNSSDDELKTSDVSAKTPFKTSDVSTKTPSDMSSDDDSDVTSMSRKQGNNLSGGTNRFSGSLQDILRRSSSYKKALLRASQSQPDISDDEGLAVDCVPDSQAV